MLIEGIKLLGMAIGGVKDYFIGSQELRATKEAGKIEILKAETAAKIAVSNAKIRMAESDQSNEFNLDKIAVEDMKTSYKDEYILGLLSIPFIMAFIPELADDAMTGFAVIKNMPDWYISLFVGIVVVIYGMRGMLTKFLERKTLPFTKDTSSGK